MFTSAKQKAVKQPFEGWDDELAARIVADGPKLFSLERERPLPLSRAWCTWEVTCTARKVARLEASMGAAEVASSEDDALMADLALEIFAQRAR